MIQIKEKSQIYRKLQRHLNKQAIGYPKANDGSDLLLLEEHFTPQHAQIALYLSFRYHNTDDIYKKINDSTITINQLKELLEEMSQVRCIFRRTRNNITEYALAPLAIGIYEYKAGNLTPDYVEKYEGYTNTMPFMHSFISTKYSQLRTIPLEESIDPVHPIATYDQVKHLIEENSGPFMVLPCICREKKDLHSEPCKRTNRRELCLAMGDFAEHGISTELGREISRKEAYDLLLKNQKEGLVLQPSHTKKAEYICSCCGCCCGLLGLQKMLPHSADFWTHDFHAEIDQSKCIGCGVCEQRCHVDAIKVSNKIAQIDLTKCIGCGVCVTTCNQNAISLVPVENPKEIHENMDEFYEELYKHKKGTLQTLLMVMKLKKGKKWHS